MPSVKLYKTNLALEIFKRIDNKYFSKKEKIFGIAVSGGPDSMLLFSLLNKWTKDNKKKLKVFTFNHNLRRESLNEGYFVRTKCQAFGCEHIHINWDNIPQTRIMERARVARYFEITKKCKELGIKTLFLGHHADDIAETISMRLLKNSSLEGLCPIYEIREIFDIKLFRPMLNIKKSEILKTNDQYNITFINDSSNTNKKYLRSRIRNYLNENRKFKNNLIIASRLFCRIKYFNLKFIKINFQNYIQYNDKGFLVIKERLFKSFPKYMIIFFLKYSLTRIGNKFYAPNDKKLSNIYNKLLKREFFISSISGCIIEFTSEHLRICREYNDIKNTLINLEKKSSIKWDNRFHIKNNTNNLIYINPLGFLLENKKYKNIYKCEKKNIKSIPFKIRKTLPVIKNLEGCVYIPHLSICEPKFIKEGIEIQALAFYDKKYDNIVS